MSPRVALFVIVGGFAGFALVLESVRRRAAKRRREIPDEAVDEASMESFPASDPPSYSAPSRVGRPVR